MKRHFKRRNQSVWALSARRIACAFMAIAVVLATIISASGCSSSQDSSGAYTLVEDGKLTVASDLATPPFEYVNDSGEDQGFTYELMGMIADELGLELNYLPAQKFDGIIPMVKQGVKTDVGACNITITDERKEEVDFTDPYIDSNQGVAVAKGTGYDTVDSLNASGVKIAVQSGTTSEEWAIENLPQATTVNFDDWTAAFTAVMSGQCQAVVCDLPVEQWMVSNSFTGMEIIKEVPTGEQFGIAVSKDNPELTQAINDALAKIKSSGAYDKLYEKWFGMAPTSGSGNENASSTDDATGSSLAVTSATAKSNENSGNGVLGGIATRLTWEATTGSDEGDVSQIALELPEGGSFESTDAKVTLLDGLNQTSVKASCSLDGSRLIIKLADPVAAGTQIRVVVPDVVFPSSAGAYAVTGSYVADGTKHELPESPTISVSESTTVQEIVAWLDAQPWVAAWNSNPFLGMFCKPQIIVTSIASLFKGWGIALAVTAIGFPLAIPIGLLFAFMKISNSRVLRGIAVTYINVLRGTPLFLQIYIAFFGFPMIGLNMPNLPLGIGVLAINCSAYLAEIFRAGIESVPHGQAEAAYSLGMTWGQVMSRIVIPQAVRCVIPTMTSEFVMLYKDTSLLSSVGVMELMLFSKNLTATTGNITPYICAALYYLVVTIPLIHIVTKVERRLAERSKR